MLGPFSLYNYPECNIPYFRNVVPVEVSQGFSIVFYRIKDSCKTMTILQNVMKSDTNKGGIMGYNEQYSLSMEIVSKSSK